MNHHRPFVCRQSTTPVLRRVSNKCVRHNNNNNNHRSCPWFIIFATCISFWIALTKIGDPNVCKWVESFSPKLGPSPHSRTTTNHHHYPKEVFPRLSVELWDSNAKNENVVYSVFSQPPQRVFRDLLRDAPSFENTQLSLASIIDGWEELAEMMDDGDISHEELQDLYYQSSLGSDASTDGLDLLQFEKFYRSIDDLFDDDDDDEENIPQEPKTADAKEELLEYLRELQSLKCETTDGEVDVGERRPWGLDSSDKERRQILEKIQSLLVETSEDAPNKNLLESSAVRSEKELTKYLLGTWDLKYTSSRTMIINKSLSGLGRSTSDLVKNRGLQMTLRGNYYFGEAEFVETFLGEDPSDVQDESISNIGDPISIEFQVSGEWMLETGTRMDPKTGRPSVSLRVEVETIAYGPNKSKADQWDSLSPIKLVDILYMDDTLMIVRGNANADAVFVYERVE